ncbi:MAG: hypothetical protein HOJ06_14705 [Rhodospirillaceae bacterium]|nr:hypothetical protein [Rhodospirillaceae bacterium]
MSSKLWEMKIPDRVTIIDCSAENPLDFKFARHAYDVSDNDWIFGGRITGKSISRIPSSTLLGALEGDYLFAKSFPDSAMLRYTGIRQQINGVHRDFTRLLLPFTGVNNDVSMLVAVTRLRNPTVIDNNMGPHSKN